MLSVPCIVVDNWTSQHLSNFKNEEAISVIVAVKSGILSKQ